MKKEIRLSGLGKTWLLDLDGTILIHNGYRTGQGDQFVEGAKEFLCSIPESDTVIFLTSRSEMYREETERFLKMHGIRFERILFGLPYGERILVNDRKPSGLNTAVAVNVDRDFPMEICFSLDETL